MAKGNNGRSVNARYNATKGNGRPKPVTPKAGYTQTRRRYESGGKTK